MPIPNEPLVKSVLAVGGRGSIIRRAVDDAWQSFHEKYPERAWWRRKSTRAALLWEHSVQNAIAGLEGDVGCKPIPHDDTVSFVFDQSVLVRFKKADIELRTRNYPTFLSNLFHSHEEDLFGFNGLHRVEAVYVLNQYQTSIDWCGIVARNHKKVLWQAELVIGSSVERIPLPERTDTAAERVLRPKTIPEAKPDAETMK